MATKIETYRVGIAGDEPCLSMEPIHKAYDKFRELYGREPEQIRVSYKAFHDLVAMAERVTMADPTHIMGMEIKRDEEMDGRSWQVCREETKHYAM